MRHLTDTEVAGAAMGAQRVLPRIFDVDYPRLDALHDIHTSCVPTTLSSLVADLYYCALETLPFRIREGSVADPHQVRSANIVLGSNLAEILLTECGRDADNLLSRESFMDAIKRLALDHQATRRDMARWLEPIIPSDSWQLPLLPSDDLATGLKAAIGCPSTGVPTSLRNRWSVLVEQLEEKLLALGFEVLPPVVHPTGKNCRGHCPANRNVDLFVVLCMQPASTRLGHQMFGVAQHLGVTLVLVAPEVNDLPCLFRDPRFGIVETRRFRNSSQAVDEAQDYVIANLGLLRARNTTYEEYKDELRTEFFVVQARVIERINAGWAPVSSGLITRAMAQHVVTDLAIYASAGGAIRRELKKSLDIKTPPTNDEAPLISALEGVFASDQLHGLNELIDEGEILESERLDLLGRAARDRVAIGVGVERRTRTFLGPEDWLRLADVLRRQASDSRTAP